MNSTLHSSTLESGDKKTVNKSYTEHIKEYTIAGTDPINVTKFRTNFVSRNTAN